MFLWILAYPEERIQYILKDTATQVVLTNQLHKQRLNRVAQLGAGRQVEILAIDDEVLQRQLSLQSKKNPKTEMVSTHLAYVIYTSGTTGNPKGVMIEHRGVVSLVKNVNYVKISSKDSFIQLANIAFDATTFEIWASLLNGAQLFVPNNGMDLVTDVAEFRKILVAHKVSVLWLTKTLFDQLYLIDQSIFKSLQYLLVGGEALSKELIAQLINSSDAPKNVINGYGPT